MLRTAAIAKDGPIPFDLVVLTHHERHLRRRVITLQHGDAVLVDLPATVTLRDRDRLVLDDGRHVEVIAADEPLMEVRAASPAALARVAWHLGNRHARVAMAPDSLTLLPDHVLKDMLTGLGATVTDIEAPFDPDPPVLTGIPHHHAHE